RLVDLGGREAELAEDERLAGQGRAHVVEEAHGRGDAGGGGGRVAVEGQVVEVSVGGQAADQGVDVADRDRAAGVGGAQRVDLRAQPGRQRAVEGVLQ